MIYLDFNQMLDRSKVIAKELDSEICFPAVTTLRLSKISVLLSYKITMIAYNTAFSKFNEKLELPYNHNSLFLH